MTLIKVLRDPGAGSGGGLTPSLAELDGAGNPVAPPVVVLDPNAPTPPVNTDPVEGSDKDGNALPGYEKQDDGTFKKIEDTPKEGEEDEDTPPTPEEETQAFLTELDNITGIKLNVDYGETDPLSPQGVAIRDQALREHYLSEYDAFIKKEMPEAYMLMLHIQAGNTPESFWNTGAPSLPDKQKFEADADLMASFLKADLISKDIPAEVAESAVAGYIKDNKLKEKAMALYTSKEREETKRIQDLQVEADKERNEYNAKVESMDTTMQKTLAELSWVVPEPDKQPFLEFIHNNIRYSKEDKKFLFTQELSNTEMKQVLESAFLLYKKGDLNSVVRKEAKKEAVTRLRTRVMQDKSATKTVETDPNRKLNIPLGEL